MKYVLLNEIRVSSTEKASHSRYPSMTVDLLCLIYFVKFHPPTSFSGATILLLVLHFKDSITLLKRGVLKILCNLNSSLSLLKSISVKMQCTNIFSII